MRGHCQISYSFAASWLAYLLLRLSYLIDTRYLNVIQCKIVDRKSHSTLTAKKLFTTVVVLVDVVEGDSEVKLTFNIVIPVLAAGDFLETDPSTLCFLYLTRFFLLF